MYIICTPYKLLVSYTIIIFLLFIFKLRRSTMVDELGVGERINRRHHMVIEAKKQLWLSGPLIIANILEKLIQVVSLMFVGHLGELPLSGASMAVSFAAVTGFSLLVNICIHLSFFMFSV